MIFAHALIPSLCCLSQHHPLLFLPHFVISPLFAHQHHCFLSLCLRPLPPPPPPPPSLLIFFLCPCFVFFPASYVNISWDSLSFNSAPISRALSSSWDPLPSYLPDASPTSNGKMLLTPAKKNRGETALFHSFLHASQEILTASCFFSPPQRNRAQRAKVKMPSMNLNQLFVFQFPIARMMWLLQQWKNWMIKAKFFFVCVAYWSRSFCPVYWSSLSLNSPRLLCICCFLLLLPPFSFSFPFLWLFSFLLYLSCFSFSFE